MKNEKAEANSAAVAAAAVGGGRAVQPQRRAADGEEADMAEAGGIECFNTEISKALFALSDIGCEGMKVPIILERQQVFFTNADESTDTEQGPD
jgi:hypothetical protein